MLTHCHCIFGDLYNKHVTTVQTHQSVIRARKTIYKLKNFVDLRQREFENLPWIEKTYPTVLKLTISQYVTVDPDASVPFNLGKQINICSKLLGFFKSINTLKNLTKKQLIALSDITPPVNSIQKPDNE